VTVPASVTIADPVVKTEGVELSWTSGSTANVYAVERRISGQDDFTRIARVDQVDSLDRMIEWDQGHEYRIRSIATTVVGEAEGRLSEVVTVTPTDKFPPAIPTGLRAVSTTASVELSWDSNQEPDLAGYRVLRDGVHISDGVERASFSDPTAVPGQEYAYAVTAIDMAGNESARSESITAASADR
jgi:fibronectin type 3 domain-containing protein